ncbi:universal stress protein [Streptomyces sp. NPDC047097]|uniref:universal stress protein n=1 Tax=Streptomyces sp. NPDC047097 TaxID=3155260 RepID=UPI0033D29FFA
MSPSVVTGLDGSAASLAAAEWAAREAEVRGLPLRLVHAAEEWSTPYGQSPPVPLLSRPRWGERMLARAADELAERHPGLKIETEQVADGAFDTLMEASRDADLLVLGSRRLTALAGYLMGSVSLAVLARATCPVALVRAPDPEDAPALAPAARAAALTAADGGADHRPGTPPATAGAPDVPAPVGEVVLGLDLAKPSDEVIAHAFAAAAERGAVLRVVHGWSMPPVFGYDPAALDPAHGTELAADHSARLRDALRPWRTSHPGVTVVEQCVVGPPAAHLTEAAAGACLVVLGRQNRPSVLGFRIGPVTHAVLHHVAPPVVVVPHD